MCWESPNTPPARTMSRALANLAMLCGHIGRPSTGVNPIRGQNNVQGACDMGALPNVLPGYQYVTVPENVQKFEAAWKAKLSSTPGLTLVEQIEAINEGKVKGLVVFGANPVVSYPDANRVQAALESLEFLLVIDIFPTPTSDLAHVVLPGASFAEMEGTFTQLGETGATGPEGHRAFVRERPTGRSSRNFPLAWVIPCIINPRKRFLTKWPA